MSVSTATVKPANAVRQETDKILGLLDSAGNQDVSLAGLLHVQQAVTDVLAKKHGMDPPEAQLAAIEALEAHAALMGDSMGHVADGLASRMSLPEGKRLALRAALDAVADQVRDAADEERAAMILRAIDGVLSENTVATKPKDGIAFVDQDLPEDLDDATFTDSDEHNSADDDKDSDGDGDDDGDIDYTTNSDGGATVP